MSIQSNPSTSEAIVTYRKQSGILQLTPSCLRWIPKDGPGSNSIGPITIDSSNLQNLFASGDVGPKAVLRIVARSTPKQPPSIKTNDSNAPEGQVFNFYFTSPTNAKGEKETFKSLLSQIIHQNRNLFPQQQQHQEPNSQTDNLQTKENGGSNNSELNHQTRTVNSERVQTHLDPLHNWKLKKRVLQNDSNLRQLHKEMVIGGQISEGEFWDGREELLYHEARLELQKSGRSAQMVDPRPETVDGGEIRISITPQMIRDIFEQYPVVQKIYNENVPPLNDQTFWTRYFRSKLFNRHRSSARQTGDAVKDDDIFDKYLDDDDDGIEPKHINTREVFKLVDLAATQEDHVETGNSNDWTMRAGTQRSSLPLMRRFNEHSQRLLDSSLGKMPQKRSGGVIDAGDAGSRNYYDNTDLEDLHQQKEPERILLDMQERERYFEGNSVQPNTKSTQEHSAKKRKRTKEEEEVIIDQVSEKINRGWNLNLGKFTIHKDDVNRATRLMLENISVRDKQKRGFDEASMPKDLLNQIVSIHATTNEFLRQFWSSILPYSTTSTMLESNIENFADDKQDSTQMIIKKKVLTTEERALKSQRMINFLMNTNNRVDFLIQNSDHVNSNNKSMILNAFKPLLNSVNTAQKYYNHRTS